MIPSAREKFLKSFSTQRYEEFLKALNNVHPGQIDFRVAETPVFVPADFKNKMLDACESIIDLILDENFISKTEASIPPGEKVKGSSSIPQMIAFDFGICVSESGEPEPRLIEMQGFPTLFGFQPILAGYYKAYFDIAESFSPHPLQMSGEEYAAVLKKTILGNHSPEEVILLEIFPEKQKTRIDFYCTEDLTGIQTVCLTQLQKEGRNIYYLRDGKKTKVKRIYNRVIFDELNKIVNVNTLPVKLTDDLDVEWVPHPDWFYRISKYTLPFIHHPYVPATYFLNEVNQLPGNLSNFVLKPLFSFAGQGVIIDVQQEDIYKIENPEQWILQEKVEYKEVIPTTNIPSKAEIRIMYIWEEGESRPKPVMNLARLSKGKMIGVRYNEGHDWVGGSIALFEG